MKKAQEVCESCKVEATTNLDFGQAVRFMKQGRLIRRQGWNGKGMHVYLEDHFHCLMGKGGGLEHTRHYLPVMVLFTAKGEHQPGWNASTPDVLAEDWEVIA